VFSLVRRSDAVEVPAITCSAKIGRATLRPIASIVGTDMARCVWRLAPSLRGRRLSGVLAVHGAGIAVRRPFARTVR
jgi:hypothetical protein